MDQNHTGTISRRTVAKGAAWAVPAAVALGAAPKASASVCAPTFTAAVGSTKCCNGKINNTKLILNVTDSSGCVGSNSTVCIQNIYPSNGGTTTSLVFVPAGGCVTVGGTITVYLQGVSNCTVNLTVAYSVNNGATQTTDLKSGNISSGNTTGECSPPEAHTALKTASPTTSSAASTSSSAAPTSSAPTPSTPKPSSTATAAAPSTAG